jgi:hypothetical protein
LKKNLTTFALLVALAAPLSAVAQQKGVDSGRYDDAFRKYSKRFFGVGFDWQYAAHARHLRDDQGQPAGPRRH